MTVEVDRTLELLNASFPDVVRLRGDEARAAVAERLQPMPNLDDVRSAVDRQIEVDGRTLRVRIYQPHGQRDGAPGVVFFHGGGFVVCSVESHDGFCRAMARALQAVVVSVDYRQAPETKAPGAAEDAYDATCWVVEHAEELGVDAERLLLAGDSAGGNLAAVTAIALRDRGGPQVAGQALIYPMLANDLGTPSHRAVGTGHFLTTEQVRWYWQQYLPQAASDSLLERVMPGRASTLGGLPPAVVVTAGLDPLCSEGEHYASRLRGAGTPVRHRHYPDLFHGFVTMLGLRAGASARELLFADLARLVSTHP